MNEITFPLYATMEGGVTDLQDALHTLLVRAIILPDDRDKRLELTENLVRDRLGDYYGDATQQVVTIFQEELGLRFRYNIRCAPLPGMEYIAGPAAWLAVATG